MFDTMQKTIKQNIESTFLDSIFCFIVRNLVWKYYPLDKGNENATKILSK